MGFKTIGEAEKKLIRREELKRKIKEMGDEVGEIEAEFKQELGDDEEKRYGAFLVENKFIDAAGKINEDKLRADFPEIYSRFSIIKIDAKALSKGEPHAYNECLLSGEAQRRFAVKCDTAKLVAKTEKRTRTDLIRTDLIRKEYE